ncbi:MULTISPECIES: ubiquitin-like small modifier protein 1 [unclassified Archaeoglobus]|jgi:molybdopterin synthase sulfur carrier subunit|uniref:ubiquitin-like small modifier protein 1 n=1 Tax=unclassified Archaeoglobus TaxID=2643606 RepID=UPI0025C62FFB|nr:MULTISPECIES: ubiquitin-like small modifier protein 1 [unclassified Archaeoglobus]
MARVKVKLFANFREAAGVKEIDIDVDRVADVLEKLGEEFPKLRELFYEEGRLREYVNIMVNGRNLRGNVDYRLQDGDVVAIFPPVSGGL